MKIGIAYVEATNRLTVEEILSLCGSEGMAEHDDGPCFMGVDQGKDLHVVIGKRTPGLAGQTVHLGIYKDWEELDRLCATSMCPGVWLMPSPRQGMQGHLRNGIKESLS